MRIDNLLNINHKTILINFINNITKWDKYDIIINETKNEKNKFIKNFFNNFDDELKLVTLNDKLKHIYINSCIILLCKKSDNCYDFETNNVKFLIVLDGNFKVNLNGNRINLNDNMVLILNDNDIIEIPIQKFDEDVKILFFCDNSKKINYKYIATPQMKRSQR